MTYSTAKPKNNSKVVSSQPAIVSSSSKCGMQTQRKPRRRRKLAPKDSSCTKGKIPPVELINTTAFIKSGTINSDIDKENHNPHQHDWNVATSQKGSPQSHPRPKSVHPSTTAGVLGGKEAKSSCPNSRYDDGQNGGKRHQKLVSDNECALQSAITNASNPITSKALINALAEASICFPNSLPQCPLVLEEKKVDIINVARKCIRLATSTAEIHSFRLANLKVAIHCLRAITPILTSTLHKENLSDDSVRMAIKLSYHCINTSEELYVEKSKEMGWLNSLSMGPAMVCFAGYQVLGVLLHSTFPGYTMEQQRDDKYIFDKFPTNGSNCFDFSSNNSTDESFTKEKIIKIAVQSCFSVSTVSWNIHFNSLSHKWSENNSLQIELERSKEMDEYGYNFKTTILATLTKDGTSSLFAFRRILCSVSMSWILSLVITDNINSQQKGVNTADASQINSVIGYTKRAGRLLIDAASQLESISSSNTVGENSCVPDSEELYEESLMLRRDYILVLLLHRQTNDFTWNPPPLTLIQDEWPTLSRVFINACGNAWKFAAAHAQIISYGIDNKILIEYHQAVGVALDGIAISQEDLNQPYVEYCAYRAMHCTNKFLTTASNCNKKGCLFHHLPFRFCHQRRFCCEPNVSNDIPSECVALAVFFIALSNKYSDNEVSHGYDIDAIIKENVVGKAVRLFMEYFLAPKCKIAERSLCLSYKILALLKLNTTVFNAVNATKTKKISSFTEHHKLSVLGKILGECYAPLNLLMASRPQSGSQKYHAMAMEGYTAAGMIFQLLSEVSVKNLRDIKHSDSRLLNYGEVLLDCSSQSDKFICKCSESMCSVQFDSTEYSILERVGKSLSYLGKRRIEGKQNKSPLLPLFLSVDAFCRMYAKSAKTEYQTSARFSHLASLLYSLRMMKEACIALLFAIKYQFHEHLLMEGSNLRNQDCTIDLLLFSDEYLSNKFTSIYGLAEEYCNALCLPLIRRLARIYTEFISNANDLSPMSLDRDTLNIIQRSYFGSVFMQVLNSENGFFLSQIVRAILVPHNQFGSQPRQQIWLVYSILHSVGNVVEGEDKFGSNRDMFLQELDNTLQQTCCSLKNESEDHHDNIAALFVVGELVRKSARKQEPSSESIACPCVYVEQADQFLHKSYQAEISCGRQVILLAYRASVSFVKTKMLVSQYEKCHSNIENDGKKAKLASPIINHFEKVAAICSEAGKLVSSNRLNSEIIDLSNKVISSLVLTLVKVYQIFDIEDASLPAAYHIKVLFDLSPACGTMTAPLLFRGELYNTASLLAPEASRHLCVQKFAVDNVIQNTELLCSRLHEGMYIFNAESSFDVDAQKQLIEELLGNACQLQIHARTIELHSTMSSIDHLIGIMQQQHAIFAFRDSTLDLVESDGKAKANIMLWLSVQWWLSSYTMALAEGCERCGEIIAALHFVRYSCMLSQSAVKMTREKFKTAVSSDYCLDVRWLGMPFSNSSTCTIPFMSRIFYCQEFIGNLYSKVGDHKKAKHYALNLAESLDLLPRRFTRDLNLADILRVVDSNVSTIRHMKCRRFLKHILFLGMPPSTIEDYLTSFAGGNHVDNFHLSIRRLLSNQDVQLNVSTNYLDWLRENTRDLILYEDFCLQNSYTNDIFEAAAKISESLLALPHDATIGFTTSNMTPLSLPNKMNCVPVNSETFGATMCKVGLRLAQILKENTNDEDKSIYLTLCKDISESRFASSTSRAEAFYYLGHEFLHLAKESGDLYDLWSGNSSVSPMKLRQNYCDKKNSFSFSSSLQAAYNHFLSAASYVGPASSLLSRHILRCLALVSGPEDFDARESLTAGELVHTSIGSSARQAVARASGTTSNEMPSRKNINPLENNINSIFDAYDLPVSSSRIGDRDRAVKEMYNLGCSLIPHNWIFIAMTICPTGELLVSSLRLSRDETDIAKSRYRTVCIPTSKRNGCLTSPNFFDEILKPFDDLMYRSQKQLKQMNSENAAENFKDKTAKKSWWDERQNIDDELQKVLDLMEERYFGVECVQDILTNSSCVKNSKVWCDNSSESNGGNLAAKFEAACTVGCGGEKNSSNIKSVSSGKESLKIKTVVQIKEDLMKYGIRGKVIRGLRKAALIDLLWTKIEEEIHHTETLNQSECTYAEQSKPSILEEQYEHDDTIGIANTNGSLTFLVLDEHLSRLPMEGIPTFRGKTVCRIPSVPFAIATLHRSKTLSNNPIPEINPYGASYVLNPELDLQGTEKRLQPALKKLSELNAWDWKGVVGSTPSKDFMEAALKKDEGLFMYCGHGGGERFFPRSRVMNLISKASGGDRGLRYRQCQASIILMGCSSGKLNSINVSNGRSDIDDHFHYEPDGIALSYLCAGAPCVIGNLWDVTDRDIDRFFLHLMDEFLGTPDRDQLLDISNLNIADCVAKSRTACKMRFIVGCAPVVYGVPVSIVLSQSRQ